MNATPFTYVIQMRRASSNKANLPGRHCKRQTGSAHTHPCLMQACMTRAALTRETHKTSKTSNKQKLQKQQLSKHEDSLHVTRRERLTLATSQARCIELQPNSAKGRSPGATPLLNTDSRRSLSTNPEKSVDQQGNTCRLTEAHADV